VATGHPRYYLQKMVLLPWKREGSIKKALKAIDNIKQRQGLSLPHRHKKLVDEYANDVFRGARDAPWLYLYALVQGKFKYGWIPENYFLKVIQPKINNNLGELTEYKTLTKKLLMSNTIPDIGYCINGHLYNTNHQKISFKEMKARVLEHEDIYIKQDSSYRGVGVMKIASKEISEEFIKHQGNCVLQLPIQQHSFFNDLVIGSVATIRVITVRNQMGSFEITGSYLRLGRAGEKWIQSSSSVRIPIDKDSGELSGLGVTDNWDKHECHPDTGTIFANKVVPNYQDVLNICINLHQSMPHLGIIGWDAAVDSKGNVKILEWNAGCGIKFIESTSGPCFRGLGWIEKE
jgi:hypothetical protein